MRIKSAFCIAKFAALLAAIAPTHPITSSLLVSRMSTDDVEYTAGIFVFEINVLSSFCACAERIPLPKRMIGRLALLIFSITVFISLGVGFFTQISGIKHLSFSSSILIF